MSKFRKMVVLWCGMMVVISGFSYGIIEFCIIRIGRFESTEKLQRANAAEERGLVDEAITAYVYASRFAKNPTDIFQTLVRLDRRAGYLDDALAHALASVESAGGEQVRAARLTLAKVYSERAQWLEARLAYQEVLTLDATCAEAQDGLARVAWEEGDFALMTEALARLRDSSLDGSSSKFRDRQAGALERLKATENRISAQGDSGVNLYALAMNQRDLGRWRESVESLEESITFADAPADAWYWLGVASESEGQMESAAEHYATALRRLPDHWRAGQRLSYLESARSQGRI